MRDEAHVLVLWRDAESGHESAVDRIHDGDLLRLGVLAAYLNEGSGHGGNPLIERERATPARRYARVWSGASELPPVSAAFERPPQA